MIRLYVTPELSAGAAVAPTLDQSRYLTQVMRLGVGDDLLVFNGRDGEWRAKVAVRGKKSVRIEATGMAARCLQHEVDHLEGIVYVDRLPEELDSFDTLLRESQQFESPGQPWRLVFTAALSGTAAQAPSDDDADKVLRRMVEAVKTGAFSAYLPFNRDGQPVRLG